MKFQHCKQTHNINTKETEHNKIKELEEKLMGLYKEIQELKEELTNEEKNDIKKIYTNEDIKNMNNKEIQEIFNNNTCYIEYLKKNGELRIFERFSFKKEFRTETGGNFDYEAEVNKFVFGIDLEENSYKRLKKEQILFIEIID